MRITTSMVQRNILADLNSISVKLAKTQAKAASNKEIARPSDNPFGTSKAMALRSNLGANEQYLRNIDEARGWMDATESALDSITQFVRRASDLVVEASTDTADATSRQSIAAEIEQLIHGIKETANSAYGDRYIMSGTATTVPPYKLGADDAYQGNEAGLDPAIAGIVREIGPGVTMTINSVASEVLGSGRADPTDGKLLNVLRDIADHLAANDSEALRTTDLDGLKGHLDALLNVRARNGAMSNRLEAASTRIDQLNGALTDQLSKTEDADIARTLIDFNSQSAAYQAALRAGATIVQSSLMDFLR